MKKALLITSVALALLVVAALGALAHGGFDRGDLSPMGVDRGTYHEQMEEIMEHGSYADLEELRAETGMPMMRWVTDDESFAEMQEHHEEMEALYGEGPHMGAYGQRDGSGFRHGRGSGRGGCPMWE